MRCPKWPCDTDYAIDPAIYLHDTERGPAAAKVTPDELARACWDMATATGAHQINLTGGEPFMQPNEQLEKFLARLPKEHFPVECFSNGSFLYPLWALDRISFVMDWKLGGSGEATTQRPNRLQNAQSLQAKDAIKFVVVDYNDLMEAHRIWDALKDRPVEFWCGPAWGRYEAAAIVEFIKEKKLPWKLNVQVHNYVYEAQERGR
jgi:7-carboxy-7-deazaguanine synthase